MKFSIKTIVAAALLATSSLAQADFSANAGFASEYHFRGILQKSSSASAGVDYEAGGFFAGTWAADVGDGLEVDGYFGYGLEIGEIDLSFGYTGYFYTGDFDDTYQEINLGGGFGILSVDVAVGEYDNFGGPKQDYTFYSLTLEGETGLYATLGGFAQDFDGEYLQLGYTKELSDIDFGIHLLFSNEDLVGDEEESVFFTIGKGFDLKF